MSVYARKRRTFTSTPAVLDPLVHLRRVGSSGPWRGDAPSGIGDLQFSHGLALRFDAGTLLAVVRAWSTLRHVEYEIPLTWDGATATNVGGGGFYFRRDLGVMPNLSTGWYGGLFYDQATGLYFSNRQGNYDTDPAVMTTSLVGPLNSSGKLTNTKKLIFSIGDKRCANVCRVPQWFTDDYLGGGDWYALCGGGGMSACATGNVSLMPSLCVFQLPAADGQVNVNCLELQGCAYSAYTSESKRQQTTNLRWQEFGDTAPPAHDGWPAQPYLTDEPGWWGWAHTVWAGMTWVDVPGISGPLFYIAEPCPTTAQEDAGKPGCEYYGHNDGSANPCSGWSGQKACLNTSAKRPVWYVTDWRQLAEVAQGSRKPEDVQSARVEFTIPGIVIPTAGWPATYRDGVGAAVAYDETRDAWIYAFTHTGGEKSDGTTNPWPVTQVYQLEVPDEPVPPEPEPPPETTTRILDADGNEVATVTVKAPYTIA